MGLLGSQISSQVDTPALGTYGAALRLEFSFSTMPGRFGLEVEVLGLRESTLATGGSLRGTKVSTAMTSISFVPVLSVVESKRFEFLLEPAFGTLVGSGEANPGSNDFGAGYYDVENRFRVGAGVGALYWLLTRSGPLGPAERLGIIGSLGVDMRVFSVTAFRDPDTLDRQELFLIEPRLRLGVILAS